MTGFKKTPNLDWLMFDFGGRRWTIRIKDRFCPPAVPEHADNSHLCIGEPWGYEQCDAKQAKAAFAEGFLQAGGKSERLDQMFAALKGQP